MTITVGLVCAAGVSSTFLAQAIRRELKLTGVDVRFEPLSADQFDQAVGELDLVLVAQHLGADFAAIAARAGSTPVVLLTSDTHGVAVTEAIAEITARTTSTHVPEGH